jgi:hypothetical protein
MSPGEIHRADRIRIVVDVRRMQPASPPSARTHSGFGPIRRTPVRLELKCTSQCVAKKRADVVFGEVFRRAVGAVDHPDICRTAGSAATCSAASC